MYISFLPTGAGANSYGTNVDVSSWESQRWGVEWAQQALRILYVVHNRLISLISCFSFDLEQHQVDAKNVETVVAAGAGANSYGTNVDHAVGPK